MTARSKASFASSPFSRFSTTWGICFSLKGNPRRLNRRGFVTVLPRCTSRVGYLVKVQTGGANCDRQRSCQPASLMIECKAAVIKEAVLAPGLVGIYRISGQPPLWWQLGSPPPSGPLLRRGCPGRRSQSDADQRFELKPISSTVVVRNVDRHGIGTARRAAVAEKGVHLEVENPTCHRRG